MECDRFRLKLKIFLGFLLVLVLLQLKSIFLWCNKLGFNPTFFGIILLIMYTVIIAGYALNRFWGYIAGVIIFSLNLLYFYFTLISGFSAFQPSAPNVLLNLALNLPGILLTTFVHGVFILYIFSTRNYFKEDTPTETAFHKVMFIFLILAFLGMLFLFYQGEQRTVCPELYTYSGDDRFSTPEKAITTDVEAFHNKDLELFREAGYYSDNFKRKLSLAGISFDNFLKMQEEKVKAGRIFDKVDRVEITKKEIINENEVYLEYTVYYRKIEGAAVSAPKNDFAYMIKVNGGWRVNLEPEFEEQFRQMGVS